MDANEHEIPRHVAVIMDGNGRWAKRRLLARGLGHRAGMKRMIALSQHFFDAGVRYVTLFALSTENLSRSKEELDGLFALFGEYFEKNVQTLVQNQITLNVIGNLYLLPQSVRELIENGVRAAAGGERGILTLAIGYGARQEILEAVNRAVRAGKEVTDEEFSALLSTRDLPDPDLLIRTGKELRLSNFLLWQSAYTELYFSEKMFPDFSNADADRALRAYAARDRRFGKIAKS